jgi:hypothetical protein
MKKIILAILILTVFVGVGFGNNHAYAKKKKALSLKERNSVACTDPDGGKNYYKKSTAKGIYANAFNINGHGSIFGKTAFPGDSGMKRTIYTDYCLNSTQLNEAYCVGGKLESIGISCPGGCKKGVCKK